MDFFAVLDLAPRASLDAGALERSYLEKSRAAHPDRFRGDPAEAVELQARVNEAFRVLEDPWSRYAHLVELRSPGLMESSKRLDPAFLAEAMEAHEEALDALGDDAAREALTSETRADIEATRARVAALLDDEDEAGADARLRQAATLLHQVRYAQRRLEALRGQTREL